MAEEARISCIGWKKTSAQLTLDDPHRVNEATAAFAVPGVRYSAGEQKVIDR